MKYPLYEMNCDDFEHLVILICNHILGKATTPFAKGKDGGRDGKFVGRANEIPSKAKPWEGTIIIQTKHTTKQNASCSDSQFKTIINKDVIPSIKNLKKNSSINYYLLFTNRSLSGIQDDKIEKQIKEATGIPILLIADEKIQNYLELYPDVVTRAELIKLLLPIKFDDSDIRLVIIHLHDYFNTHQESQIEIEFAYPGLKKKNKINNLGKNYFDNSVRENMNDFNKIKQFLSNPVNQDITNLYNDAVSELQAKIMQNIHKYPTFEDILEECYNVILEKNSDVLKMKKKLIRVLLHYMYCNCDIGKKK